MGKRVLTSDEARTLAATVFLKQFPDDNDWFAIAWDALADCWATNSNQEEVPGLRVLAAAGPTGTDTRAMAREIAVLFEILIVRFPIVAEELSTRLETVGRRHQCPKPILERLSAHLTPELERRNLVNKVVRCSYVTVTTFLRGEAHIEQNVACSEVARLPKGASCDLLVDEVADELEVKDGPARSTPRLGKMPRNLRALLWFVLARAGKVIEHADLGKVLWPGPPLDPYVRSARIHQLRRRLEVHYLGEALSGRIFEQGKSFRYIIRRTGWSYRWIRIHADEGQSVLLRSSGVPDDGDDAS